MEAHAVEAWNPLEPARAKFDELSARLMAPDVMRMEHGEVEALIDKEGREVMRRLLEGHLASRGVGEVAETVSGSDGAVRGHARVTGRSLMSLFGPVRIERAGYRSRSAATLFPRDAELNLPANSYSHGVRRRIAYEAARGSFDTVTELMASTTGAAVPKRQAEGLAVMAAADFDEFYRMRAIESANAGADDDSLLVISVDGKGVVMRPDYLREATRKAAQARQPRLEHRRSKGEKSGSRRMATVATVYTIAPFFREPRDIVKEYGPVSVAAGGARPRPQNKRVWASLERTPAEVVADAFDEADKRDPARSKSWVALVDGNRTQLRLLRKEARRRRVNLTIVLDIVHVIEYLWAAAYAFCSEGSREAEQWVSYRLDRILRGEAGLVAGGMRRSATKRGLSRAHRQSVDDCARYLINNKKFLDYPLALASGTPIATGVIEGACRHIIKDRLDITGARWSLKGAEAILRLRSLRASGDLDEYWRFHECRELQRIHLAKYENATVPPTLPPAKPTLRRHLRAV